MKLKLLPLGLPILFFAQLASAELLSVKTATANFRELPHEASKIKFTADKFYPVEVVEKKAGWVKVKDFEGDTAWVAQKVLAKQATVVISMDRATVREAANTKSDVLFKVERGEVFKIEEKKGDWIKVVDAHGDGGWIRNDMTWGDSPAKEDAEPTKSDAGVLDVKASDKSQPKESASKAKEADKAADAKASDKREEAETTRVSLSSPDHLEMLCQAYLDNPPVRVEFHSEKAGDKHADKPTAEKKAEKKAAKPAPKPAVKPAAKPAPKKK